MSNTANEVQQFLGLCNYNRQFVHQLSEIAPPSSKLTRKDVPFKWSSEQQEFSWNITESFQFILDTDVAHISIWSLQSYFRNGKKKVNAYVSKKLDKQLTRYSVTSRESLAISTCIHLPLLRWSNFVANVRQGILELSWLVTLSQHNFQIQDIPGVKHQNADTFLRREYDISFCHLIKKRSWSTLDTDW